MRPSPSTLCTWATTPPDSSDSRLCISMPQLLPFEVLGYKEHKALREAVRHLLRFDGRIETTECSYERSLRYISSVKEPGQPHHHEGVVSRLPTLRPVGM